MQLGKKVNFSLRNSVAFNGQPEEQPKTQRFSPPTVGGGGIKIFHNVEGRGEFRGGMPPNRRLSGFFFTGKRLCWDCSLYHKCSVDLKYAKKCVGGRGAGGALDVPPDPLVR